MKDFLLMTIIVIGMLVALVLALWLWVLDELNEDTWIIVAVIFMSGYVLSGLALPSLRKADRQRKMWEERNRRPDRSNQDWSGTHPGGRAEIQRR